MAGHRAGPRPGLLGHIDTSKLVLYGITLLAGGASAVAAFITSQIQPQVDKVRQQVQDVPDQLRDATNDLQQNIDDAGARLDRKATERQADLDRLTAALRALQAPPEPVDPAPDRKPTARHTAPSNPTPTPRAAAPTSAPQDPAAQVCEALKLQCEEDQ